MSRTRRNIPLAPVTADANDLVDQWEASHDCNPSPGLEKIEATVLAINAADDERNPPETGVTDAAANDVTNRFRTASISQAREVSIFFEHASAA
jgi:hypothetical protein